jgi:transcriptional regulator with XRE-family HTH domain
MNSDTNAVGTRREDALALAMRSVVSATVGFSTMSLAPTMLLATRTGTCAQLGRGGDAMDLAERIRKARRIAGMSQQALADAMGVTRSAVGNWEIVGGARPASARLAQLACTLRVNFEWLATGRGEMQVDECIEDRPAVDGLLVIDCPHERRLLLGYRRAPARLKVVLQDLVRLHVTSRLRDAG